MVGLEPAHVYVLKADHDELVSRAKELFAAGGYDDDPKLVEQIKQRDILPVTRTMILHHRRGTLNMEVMNHDAQFRLLGRQLEIFWFLYEWDRYVERRREIANG
jgi:hypothetical protein